MSSVILAIESSCDDTAASVIAGGKVLSNVVYSQLAHEQYGGVVPEVASRAHHQSILPVVKAALQKAGMTKTALNAVACTRGPGLMGSLLVGFTFAKTLAQALDIPLIEVHHMQAHILAHFIEPPYPSFPFLCLTVSGGHTQLVIVHDHLNMEVVGSTLDDAAGEAFDKTGKMLGLKYPAGPEIDRLAALGNPIYSFPEPQVDGLNFSFSGLKTAVLYFLREKISNHPDFIALNRNDIAASIQHTIVQTLLHKLKYAAQATGIDQIALAGGVSANRGLRSALENLARTMSWKVYLPAMAYCTDNAAMIAITAHYKYQRQVFSSLDTQPDPRLAWDPEHLPK